MFDYFMGKVYAAFLCMIINFLFLKNSEIYKVYIIIQVLE
ncbi:hypothetical protein HMPREF1142_0652 [Peptostreptococcaceae bacterium AS15]|nr:hypothetical protein HMPREF1142_0652 [Peptostreptococcaceae bacterium AS15]